ncbi:hypothetical protein KUTeg_007004 [Tegillarca granosa]|uniref:Uncharacterized protein n=1 Tax=Tegillarca granosa TaxID=220873 RepID=A0ABQ9FC09_TEGGR|nr:hypothetical protein KUTeg_007004 [Tegillarca granosa]
MNEKNTTAYCFAQFDLHSYTSTLCGNKPGGKQFVVSIDYIVFEHLIFIISATKIVIVSEDIKFSSKFLVNEDTVRIAFAQLVYLFCVMLIVRIVFLYGNHSQILALIWQFLQSWLGQHKDPENLKCGNSSNFKTKVPKKILEDADKIIWGIFRMKASCNKQKLRSTQRFMIRDI